MFDAVQGLSALVVFIACGAILYEGLAPMMKRFRKCDCEECN